MPEKYTIKINDTSTIELTGKNASELDSISESGNRFHILKNNQAYKAKLIRADFDRKTYVIRVNSNTYNVKIEAPIDQLIQKMGFSFGSSKKLNQIKAPMPGIILQVPIQEGDTVKEGDTVLILEAMKMENAILSPKDGEVKAVYAGTGETVDKGKLLIELK